MERKWTDYTTKTTPADNDEVLELSTNEKVQKRLTLGNLSDWILNKVADKVYSKLETNSKTLVTAINELNSKALKPFYSGSISTAPLTVPMNPGVYLITTYRYGGFKISSLSILNIQTENGSFLETIVKGKDYDNTVEMTCTERSLSSKYKISMNGACGIKIYKIA